MTRQLMPVMQEPSGDRRKGVVFFALSNDTGAPDLPGPGPKLVDFLIYAMLKASGKKIPARKEVPCSNKCFSPFCCCCRWKPSL